MAASAPVMGCDEEVDTFEGYTQLSGDHSALAVLVVVSPLSGGLPLRAAEPPPTAGSAAAGDEAMAILDRMASFLAKAENFSVKIRTGYDAVQGSGERIEFGERRSVVVARPDRFRVEVERSDGERILLLFDGKEITAFLGEDLEWQEDLKIHFFFTSPIGPIM